MLTPEVGKARPQLADGPEHGLLDRPVVRAQFVGDLADAPLLEVLQDEAHSFDLREARQRFGQASPELGILTGEQFDEAIKPEEMVGPLKV